jgi:hypothetical protein
MQHVPSAILLTTLIIGLTSIGGAAEQSGAIELEFKQHARADWDAPVKGPEEIAPDKNSGWIEFDVTVPATAWYELHAHWGAFTHELFLDGRRLYYGGTVLNPGDPIPPKGAPRKLANLPLTAGKHTLRVQRLGRVGFPASWPEKLILTPNADKPASALLAVRASIDVIRLGETVAFELTGGCLPAPSVYTIAARNMATGVEAEMLKVEFPAGGEFVTRTVEVRPPEEGGYQLTAKCGAQPLTAVEFRPFEIAVIDTATRPAAQEAPKPELVLDLDCARQTLNGQPVAQEAFFEANGASRVRETPAGAYRETGDGLAPEVDKKALNSERFSGFTYHLDLPKHDGPFILEIDYPDDDWRYGLFMPVYFEGDWNVAKPQGFSPPTGGALCGGPFPLSGAMKTHRQVFWTHYPKMSLTVLSARVGARAAAAKIRVYRCAGDLPALAPSAPGGRLCATWNEQRDDWKWIVGAKGGLPAGLPQTLQDLIAWKRLVTMTAWAGMNAVWSTDLSYQQVFYHSDLARGYLPHGTEHARMGALFCEKYGMKYIAEIFLSGGGFRLDDLSRLNPNIEELRTKHFTGIDSTVGGLTPAWNIAHPVIQQKMIDLYGELADKLGDSPAFAGMCGRIDGWLWNGHYGFTSIHWGYEDYTIARFQRETGVSVPGAGGDPQRFQQRYEFLTAPDMRERWIRWRTDVVMDYLQRLVARIRLKRPETVLFLAGDGQVDYLHGGDDLGSTPAECWRNMGIDIARLAGINGIAIVPTHSYGRGKSHNLLAEQASVDTAFDPENVGLGRNAVRAFAFYNQYDEWGDHYRAKELGIPAVGRGYKQPWITGASDYAGRHGLARYAAVLAEQDSMVLRDGGYGWTWGNPEIRGAWLREFNSIPAVPFEPLAAARDPVAVWQSRQSEQLSVTRDQSASTDHRSPITDHFFFYAVNREGRPLSLTLEVNGARKITRLGTGEEVAIADGRLVLDLDSYELRAFRAPPGARLAGAAVAIPADYRVGIQDRLVAARQVEKEITSGRFRASVTDGERSRFQETLARAWNSFGEGRLWSARTLLASAPMMKLYDRIGRLPDGQVVTRFSDKLTFVPGDRFEPDFPLLAEETLKTAAPAAPTAASATYHPEWAGETLVESQNGTLAIQLAVPASGPYRLVIGHASKTPGVVTAALNGQGLPLPMTTHTAGSPEKTAFPAVTLTAGEAGLTLAKAGEFGVYAVGLEPVLRPLPANLWRVIGPFRGGWGRKSGKDDELIRADFAKIFPPQQDLDMTRIHRTEDGRELGWLPIAKPIGTHSESGVNFAVATGSASRDICYALTHIVSPDERVALLYLGTDWWATAYLNGEEVVADDPKPKAEFNCAFNRWKPKPALIKLKKGVNTLLVKNHGGSAANWFTARISDQPDLEFRAKP